MKILRRILGFLICLAMMTTAAINCHKSLLGRDLSAMGHEEAPDTVMTVVQGQVEINTTSLSQVKGFGGRVPMTITFDERGRIMAVTLLRNAETPSFIERTKPMMDEWIGRSAEEVLAMKTDATSGATMSSNAIRANMEAGVRYYLAKRDSIKVATEDMPEQGNPDYKVWLALAVTLIAAIVPLFVKSRRIHTLILLLDVVVLGFWCGRFISYSVMVNYLSSGVGIWTGIVPIAMMAVAFIYPIFGRKQHYCNYVCPLGAIQQLAGMSSKKKLRINVKLVKGLQVFRQILWGGLMFFLWIPFAMEWMDYELFGAFIVESASWGILVAAGAVMLLSVVIPRPYCNYVCPTGTLIKVEEFF